MQPGNWQDLEALQGPDLANRLDANLDAVMDAARAQGHEDDAILASLPEALRVLQLLRWLDFEVTMGSFIAYFTNSSGRHAEQAVAALRRIGADEMAGVLQEAHAVVQRNRGAWAERRDELDEAEEFDIVDSDDDLPGADELDALADAYREAAERGTWWGVRLEQYLESERTTVARWAAA